MGRSQPSRSSLLMLVGTISCVIYYKKMLGLGQCLSSGNAVILYWINNRGYHYPLVPLLAKAKNIESLVTVGGAQPSLNSCNLVMPSGVSQSFNNLKRIIMLLITRIWVWMHMKSVCAWMIREVKFMKEKYFSTWEERGNETAAISALGLQSSWAVSGAAGVEWCSVCSSAFLCLLKGWEDKNEIHLIKRYADRFSKVAKFVKLNFWISNWRNFSKGVGTLCFWKPRSNSPKVSLKKKKKENLLSFCCT